MRLSKMLSVLSLAILLLSGSVFAQSYEADPRYPLGRGQFGIKVGLNWADFIYSGGEFADWQSDYPEHLMFEVFGEIMFTRSFSARPGLKYVTRGQHVSESVLGSEYEWRFDAPYLEVSVPLAWTFPGVGGAYPYVFAGPVIGFSSGGEVSSKWEGHFDRSGDITTGIVQSNAVGL